MKKILFITRNRKDAIWIVDENLKKQLKKLNTEIVFFELPAKWTTKFEILWNYFRASIIMLIKSFSYKTVFFSWENLFVVILRLFYPFKKIIMMVHHMDGYWGNKFTTYIILKSCNKFVSISNFTKNQLILWNISADDVIVNYNWVDQKYYPEKIQNFQKFKYLLYVWDEYSRKNLKWILTAFAKLVKKYPELKFIKIWKVQNPQDKINTDKIITDLSLQNNVILKREFVDTDDLRLYYSNAECLLLVSFLEWFGMSVPEAMSCACPVVVSDRAPMTELVQNQQIRVDPENIDDIFHWIDKILSDENLKKHLSAQALELAQNFDRAKAWKQLNDFLKNKRD